MARRLLVISAASAVFVVAFILDTGAVARLFWACLAGQLGQRSRIAALGILLLLCCVIALVLYRPARLPPVKARNKTARRPIRNEGQAERNGAIDDSPAEVVPAAKRRSRRNSNAATDQPL